MPFAKSSGYTSPYSFLGQIFRVADLASNEPVYQAVLEAGE